MNWIGYYYTVGTNVGYGFEDNLDLVADLGMNWAHVEIDNILFEPETVEIAKRAEQAKIAVAYSVVNLLWIPGVVYGRHTNWKARFAEGRASIDAFADRGVLHSVYVADEPTGHGIPQTQLNEVCEFLRTETPYPTMLVEDSISIAKPLPVVDYFGVTHYTPREFRAGHEMVLQDGRINVVVAQGFNEQPHAIPEQRQWKRLFDRIKHREGATLALFTLKDYKSSDMRLSYTGSASVPAVLMQHEAWAAELVEKTA